MIKEKVHLPTIFPCPPSNSPCPGLLQVNETADMGKSRLDLYLVRRLNTEVGREEQTSLGSFAGVFPRTLNGGGSDYEKGTR